MYVDIDSNLVVIVAGYDSLGYSVDSNYKRFILLTKFSMNGQMISNKIDYIANYTSSIEHLGEIDIQPNGDIIVSHDGVNNLHYEILINKYNKNFDSLFSHRVTLNLVNENLRAPLAIASKDSLLNIAYATSTASGNNMNHWYLIQLNTNTGDTVWQQSIHNFDYYNYPIQLEIMNNALYLVSYHITKLSLVDGSILNENSSNYASTDCIFDHVENRIYAKNHNTKEINVFEGTGLQVINSISLNSWPSDIVKLDSIVTVIGLNQSVLDPYSNNLVEIYRLNTNLVLQNSLFYEYIKPIYATDWNGHFKPEIMVDKNNEVIVMSEVHSKPYYNNLGQSTYTAPIFLQKVCFNCMEDIRGRVFIDTNNNCINDSSDIIVENNLIHLMPEDVYTSTDSEGYYYFFKTSGIATIEYVPSFSGLSYCNNTSSYTVNTANGYQDSLDFGLVFRDGFYKDIATKIVSGASRPGFYELVFLDISNLSNQVLYNSTVSINIDSNFSFLSSDITPDSMSGQQIFWVIDSIKLLDKKSIQIKLLVNGQLGDTYKHSSHALVFNDINTSNNHDTTGGTIIGSFDPNYIAVDPVGLTKKHYIENGTSLDYYIEFQNTGTDTAFNIKIFDELDENLDLETFKFTGSSHDVKYVIEGRTLKFYFDDVLLVDSNKSYEKSIGYLTYSIKPTYCIDGTVISNKAAIYFDFNTPVITNAVFHTIGKPGSFFDPNDKDDFNIFPNPSKTNNLNLVVNLVNGPDYTIQISNLVGRKIDFVDKRIFINGKYYHSIQLSENETEGIYLICLRTSKKAVVKKWLYSNY